jgi:hypothetical protein
LKEYLNKEVQNEKYNKTFIYNFNNFIQSFSILSTAGNKKREYRKFKLDMAI